MSRDITEKIDDYCEEQLGHTNWAIISTLTDQENVGIETQGILNTFKGVDVIFYWESCCWHCDELTSKCICEDGEKD